MTGGFAKLQKGLIEDDFGKEEVSYGRSVMGWGAPFTYVTREEIEDVPLPSQIEDAENIARDYPVSIDEIDYQIVSVEDIMSRYEDWEYLRFITEKYAVHLSISIKTTYCLSYWNFQKTPLIMLFSQLLGSDAMLMELFEFPNSSLQKSRKAALSTPQHGAMFWGELRKRRWVENAYFSKQ